MLYDNQGSYEPDMAELIDTEEEIIADELGVPLHIARRVLTMKHEAVVTQQAQILGQFIGLLLNTKNQPAVIYAFALAAGLDQLNGIKTETEVAKMLGCTRALISHYVVAARDILSGNAHTLDVLKFRKRNETRATYAEQAKSPFIAAKIKARKKYKQQDK